MERSATKDDSAEDLHISVLCSSVASMQSCIQLCDHTDKSSDPHLISIV